MLEPVTAANYTGSQLPLEGAIRMEMNEVIYGIVLNKGDFDIGGIGVTYRTNVKVTILGALNASNLNITNASLWLEDGENPPELGVPLIMIGSIAPKYKLIAIRKILDATSENLADVEKITHLQFIKNSNEATPAVVKTTPATTIAEPLDIPIGNKTIKKTESKNLLVEEITVTSWLKSKSSFISFIFAVALGITFAILARGKRRDKC